MKQKLLAAKGFVYMLVACMLALCLGIGLCFAVPKSAQAAGDGEEEERIPVVTYVLGAASGDIGGANYYANRIIGWNAATAKAVELAETGADNTLVKVVLADDWTASGDAQYVTSFGTGNGFANGRICVPANADMVLDLNGKIIDRALTEAASLGHILTVNGSLEIIDSAPQTEHDGVYTYRSGVDEQEEPTYTTVTGGVITGGFSNGAGGGIYVSGTVVMRAGSVVGNTASNGGGIYTNSQAVLKMYGGAVVCGNAIKGNNSSNGAGVRVHGGEFIMYGGIIADNGLHPTAAHGMNGGGVSVESNGAVAGSLTVYGGKITYNRAPTGGGVYANGTVKFVFCDGEISHNAATGYVQNAAGNGGGININGANVSVTLLAGKIINNTATGQGGGISISGATVVMDRNEAGTGVEITDNTAKSYGGGINASGGTLEMRAGKINDNVAQQTGNIGGGGVFMNGKFILTGGEIKGNQSAAIGGAMYVNSGTLSVAGSPVVEGNVRNTDSGLQTNNIVINKAVSVIGAFDEGAKLCFISTGATFIDYGKYNSPEGYAVNPAEYIYSDSTTYNAVLNSEGTVQFRNFEVNWTLNDDPIEDYGLAFEYGAKAIETIKLNGKDIEIETQVTDVLYDDDGNVSSYAFVGRTGSGNLATDVKFEIRIVPKKIADDDVALDSDTFSFTGAAIEPAATVVVGDATLVRDTDYTVTYTDNRNVGNATAVIAGKGNYAGVVGKEFTVTKGSAEYSAITWQYFDGENWATIDVQTRFVYDSTNQRDKVRAELTIDENVKDYVYAQGVTPTDVDNWCKGMWLTFAGVFGNVDYTTFVNSTRYEVTLVDNDGGNAEFAADIDKTTFLTMYPAVLDVTDEDFEDVDGLWLVAYNGARLPLLDGADVTYLVNGEAIEGDANKTDSYARYRSADLVLTLNNDCSIGNRTLESYLQSATVTYNNNRAAGAVNALTTVETTAVLTFNGNYTTGEAGNTITISKIWYIVSINNGFTTLDKEPLPTVSDWVYGGERSIVEMMPEHGNTIMYRITKNNVDAKGIGNLPTTEFAAVFGEQSGEPTVSYYEVKDGGIDFETPVADEWGYVIKDYFNYCLARLGKGSYTLRVSAPEFYDEDGIVYYTTATEFTFAVESYNIADNGLPNAGVAHSLRSLTVPYNGESNNTPKVLVTLNGRELVENVDYELLSDGVNVGWANLTIRGIDGLTGEYTISEAFEIVQTVNGWQRVPSIISWIYGSYNADINLISAQPTYLDFDSDLQFKVTIDEDGKKPVSGLSLFSFDNGKIPALIENKLAKLDVGDYYLFATVQGTANYTALAPDGVPFSVKPLTNAWLTNPAISGWTWGEYSEPVVVGTSTVGNVVFTVKDENGLIKTSFDIREGKLPADASNVLKNLTAGTYTLSAHVDGDKNGNYNSLDGSVAFVVAQAKNGFETSVGVQSWIIGKFGDLDGDAVTGKATYGDIIITVTDADNLENVYYTGALGTEELTKTLFELGEGSYGLSAKVAGTANYAGAEDYIVFRVLPKEGLAWWAILLIVLGVLAVIAVAVVILQVTGVIQLLTGKMVLALRNKAAVDATVAAVRANMIAEQSKKTRAEAEKREKMEELRKAREEAKNRPVEEQVAALETQAEETVKRAEKLQKRAETIKKRAATMKAKSGKETTATDEAAAENPVADNTSTEE